MVSLASPRVVAGSLGFAGGVMLYVVFTEIFSRKAFESFLEAGSSRAGAYRLATACFFGGILMTALLDACVHAIMHWAARHQHHRVAAHAASQAALVAAAAPQQQPAAAGEVALSMVDSSSRGRQLAARDASMAGCSGGGSEKDLESGEGSGDSRDSSSNSRKPIMVTRGQGSGRSARWVNAGVGEAACDIAPGTVVCVYGVCRGLAIALHNIPEGLATFVGALNNTKVGASIAAAIAIHNVPEGICVGMPIYYATGSKWKGFLWGSLTGMAEPVGGLLGYVVLHEQDPLSFGIVFGIVAGMMVYVSVKELLPSAFRFDPKDSVVSTSVLVGMGVMAVSLVLFTLLNGNVGRQTWEWDPEAGTPEERARVEELRAQFTKNRLTQKSSADELLRMQCEGRRRLGPFTVPADGASGSSAPRADTVAVALRNGMSFYEGLQADDGHWPGDYGGPMFLMPGMVIALHTTEHLEKVLSPQHRAEMVRYLHNHQNADGGYGLHIEGTSTMFGTALSYVTLRLLGVGPDAAGMAEAREWMHSRGGAHHITSWGKFWLAVLGVYSWDGLNPMPPEMWLLPYSGWTGIGWAHPGRFWCHCRMVYLPMSYAYGRRATAPPSPLTEALRQELYPLPYGQINWNKARNACAKEDLYYPHPLIQDVLWWTLYQAEPLLLGSRLRNRALKECMKHIHYEDENTRYVDIGPVNKVLNMLCCWLEDPDSEAFKRHLPRLFDYLWVAEDGMKMQGYNGSQLWDTAFAVQAIAATGRLAKEFSSCLRNAHDYIEKSQVVEEAQQPLSEYYRHISKGAWPFSSRDHGWPISDCSSEGLKAALTLAQMDSKLVGPPIPTARLEDCVNVILSYQNSDGGWATYENKRSFEILETINPSETFGEIVVDYNHVECSTACITALTAFRRRHPEHRSAEISTSLKRGLKYLKSIQRKDGSWYGNWGVCFTYATWFGCEALAAMDEGVANSVCARSAAAFLLGKQRADGGWGESYLSCQDKVYSQLPGDKSHAVNTAWALLALLAAGYHEVDRKPLDAAARCLIRLQEAGGDWPQQHISGVFNRNCMITYANYRNIFPIWALGEYRSKVLGQK
ncbi:Cycloartenol synthase isoform B [Micractinium conductrix]|uniref:Cycloartenol synthase isoform B n=1 Tax=Micractinium conductrix TaxID=554055 RepID=A0A2P6V8D5_9CHLO|nr:Cycloartenol synthase isoform B [Micractinium conductrix]|eukprot:PSC70347.1 Cycloartenol synthase isoform B [Micractinium conductrix]